MTVVACVLRSGGIYDVTWVERLQAGVTRYASFPHRFLCLSDVPVSCERIPLEHGWPGWWSKIELFKLPGPVLYFDLDTAIVGDLSHAAGHAANASLTMLRDFYAPTHFGSGVMAWSGDVSRLYRHFAESPDEAMTKRRARMGDQAFIEEAWDGPIAKWQDVLPDQVVSYKVHCRGGIPPDARVVCLHGSPKFADMPSTDPVRQAWERAA